MYKTVLVLAAAIASASAFAPAPRYVCFVKMLRSEIVRRRGGSLGFRASSSLAQIIATLLWTATTPFLLVWGQVGEVWAHYCRGVVVN